MMANMRTKRSPEFKAKIALAALRGDSSYMLVHGLDAQTWPY